MPAITQGPNLGDLLKYEADHYYSRDLLEVAPNQDLKQGAVVALKESLVVFFAPKAEDGSQHPLGVLLEDIKTTTQKGQALCLVRHSIVLEGALLWPEALEDEEKRQALVALKTLGILTRKGV